MNMFLSVFKKSKNRTRLTGILLLLGFTQPVFAAGPPAPSPFSNPLTVTLIVLMTLLLIIIGILANILIGSADIKMRKDKKKSAAPVITSMLIFLLLSSASLFAQSGSVSAETTTATTGSIGGMSAMTFYIIASVIFLELSIILVLLFNIKFMLKVEKEKAIEVEKTPAQTAEEKKSKLSWWDKFNKLRPVTQESELDLGHDYDGIRELNNRLPPWWLYGFYLTIIVSCIYLWRYHVSHTAPLSKEEFETSVANGEREVAQYLKMKGDNIDENTVVFLSNKEDIEAGRSLFTNGPCVTCHGEDGSGIVMGQPGIGPNLTDDYWLHGGNIKNIFTTIKYGFPTKGMQPWESTYSAKEIAQLSSYVKSLHGTKPANAKEKQGDLYIEEQTSPAMDSLKNINDSLKPKENKVVVN